MDFKHCGVKAENDPEWRDVDVSLSCPQPIDHHPQVSYGCLAHGVCVCVLKLLGKSRTYPPQVTGDPFG